MPLTRDFSVSPLEKQALRIKRTHVVELSVTVVQQSAGIGIGDVDDGNAIRGLIEGRVGCAINLDTGSKGPCRRQSKAANQK